MVRAERWARNDREVREMARQAREDRGMLPQQVAAAAGASPDDVEFIETHGVAVTPSMLAVLDYQGIEDYESDLLTRLAQLIPGGRGSLMVQHLVEGGFKTIRAIESSAAGDLLGLPWFDLKQMSLLRQGLDLYNRAEALGEVDYS